MKIYKNPFVSRESYFVKMGNKMKKCKKNSTLCWNCEKACGRCSWSRKFVPIDGWVAIPTKLLIGNNFYGGKIKRIYIDSFDVYECPEFELLEILK